MPSARDTIKHLLLAYPGQFPSPFKAAEALFTRSSWTWQEGELVPRSPLARAGATMDFSDLDERSVRLEADAKDWQANPGLWERMRPLHEGRVVDGKFARMQRQFVGDHMEALLDAGLDHEFRPEGKHALADPDLTVMNHFSIEHAALFNFPDDVAPDWAKLIHDFTQTWHCLLATRHGPTRGQGTAQEQDVSHWPDGAQTLYAALLTVSVRLYPIMNQGESHADGLARRQALSQRLIAEMRAEEKVVGTEGDRKRTPRPRH